MEIRLAQMSDLEDMQLAFANARSIMKKNGNPMQWRDEKPSIKVVLDDIENRRSYVAYDGGELCGTFAFILGTDPTYVKIFAGSWLNDENYGVIHRLATSGKRPGFFKAVLDFAFTMTDNLRVDTHIDNTIMHHILLKNGFTRCGVIWLEEGEGRIAFQKVKEK